MLISTECETYYRLDLQWEWSEIGYIRSATSLHRTQHGAEAHAHRIITEKTGTPGSSIETMLLSQHDGNLHAEMSAAGKPFTYTISTIEVFQ